MAFAMHFRTKAPAGHPQRHPGGARDRGPRSPSAAWLAAQEAFSAPRTEVAAGPAVVILRKPKVSMVAGEQSAMVTAGAAADKVADKAARVFRVVTEPAAAEAMAQAPLPEPTGEPAQALPLVRRRRRVDAEKRPGPVLRIVHAPVVLPDAGGSAASGADMSSMQIAELKQMLASVDGLLGDIRRARSFQFF